MKQQRIESFIDFGRSSSQRQRQRQNNAPTHHLLWYTQEENILRSLKDELKHLASYNTDESVEKENYHTLFLDKGSSQKLSLTPFFDRKRETNL